VLPMCKIATAGLLLLAMTVGSGGTDKGGYLLPVTGANSESNPHGVETKAIHCSIGCFEQSRG
jgi:hypothetical protein